MEFRRVLFRSRSAPVRAENRNSSLIVPHLVPSYPVICGQADPHAVKVKQRAGGVSPLIIDVETEPDPLVGKPGQATAQPITPFFSGLCYIANCRRERKAADAAGCSQDRSSVVKG